MIGRQTLEVIYESRFSEYYLNIVRDFQIYWGSTTTRLFSLKFTGHFQNIFFSMWIFEEDFYKAFEVYAVVFLSVWFLCGARFFFSVYHLHFLFANCLPRIMSNNQNAFQTNMQCLAFPMLWHKYKLFRGMMTL